MTLPEHDKQPCAGAPAGSGRRGCAAADGCSAAVHARAAGSGSSLLWLGAGALPAKECNPFRSVGLHAAPMALRSWHASTFEPVLGTVGAIRPQRSHARHPGVATACQSTCHRGDACLTNSHKAGIRLTPRQPHRTAPVAKPGAVVQAGLAAEPWVRQAVLSSSPSLEGPALSAQVQQLQGLLQQVHKLGAEGADPLADSEVCPCCLGVAGSSQLWLACMLPFEQAGGRLVAEGTKPVQLRPMHCFCLQHLAAWSAAAVTAICGCSAGQACSPASQ